MSNYKFHAQQEFRAVGWVDENGKYTDEMQGWICDHVLALLDVFADEGHSGSSAPYTINVFSKLAKFEPIAPLTGEDWEWTDVSNGEMYQNNRMSSVFKDSKDGQAYWSDGRVFWEWYSAPDIDEGKPFKSYFTSRDSRVSVTFPWTKPDKNEYVFVPTVEYPNEVL